jgi:hypothetical protein
VRTTLETSEDTFRSLVEVELQVAKSDAKKNTVEDEYRKIYISVCFFTRFRVYFSRECLQMVPWLNPTLFKA